MTAHSLDALGKTLSDSFFHGLDRAAVLEAIRAKQDTLAVREKMVDVWGVTDGAVLNALVELGLTTEIIAVIALTPLVEVAWADGKVTAAERRSVLDAAASFGLAQRDFCQTTLARWLTAPPPTEALQEWRRVLGPTLAATEGRSARATERELLAAAHSVARMDELPLDIGSGLTEPEAEVLRDLSLALADADV
jgi:hypothetical protein